VKVAYYIGNILYLKRISLTERKFSSL